MTKTKLRMVELWTDGSCLVNPGGPGGWAALLVHGGRTKLLSGGAASSTNNTMELLAVIEGLKALNYRCEVQVWSDSKYVVDAWNRGWIGKWRENGWRNSQDKPVANKELWLRLSMEAARHKVTWHWVKGHADAKHNIAVDKEAHHQAHIWELAYG